jgi:hypothetical protein
MYVGSSQARTVIREYEFYFPKNHKKIKKKKSGQVVSESKQDRIKFDVLLTSYEMINLDSTSLKPIKWDCMVTFCDSLCTLPILNVCFFGLMLISLRRLLMKVIVSKIRIQNYFLH